MYSYTYNTQIGNITIVEKDGYIANLYINHNNIKAIQEETKLIKQTFNEIKEYLDGNKKSFSIPIKTEGTDFQKKVWQELLKIPYGETKSYKDIAININNSKACRAVGTAIKNNPIPIIIPCHRVINSNKNLGGYAYGLEIKKILLKIEKNDLLF